MSSRPSAPAPGCVARGWQLRACASLVILAWGILGHAPTASAQSSLQIPLQFDFLNPGAKAKAMGGSFVGLADDATATFANPAGLVLIGRTELSLEARATRVETPFLAGGRLSGAVIGEGLDTVAGPVFGSSVGTDAGVAFASVIAPRGAWSLAGYRHELVRVDQRFTSTGVFQQLPGGFTSTRELPQQAIRRLAVTGYGVAVGYRPFDELSVGLGFTVYDFAIDSVFSRLDTVGFLGPAQVPVVEIGRSTQVGRDRSVAPTVGVLLGLTGRGRIGLTYRHGASFTFETQSLDPSTGIVVEPARPVAFRVPHTLAVGGSFRPSLVLTLAAEVTYVRYARLREEFVTDQARFLNREDDFSLDSGTELHVGAQYLPTLNYMAPKIRAGLWVDPDHSVMFRPVGAPAVGGGRLLEERLQAALSTGARLVHYTGGLGLSLSPRVELNAAVDLTSQSRVLSASVVVR